MRINFKLKNILYVAALLLVKVGYSQVCGGLLVRAYENSTLNLKDNVALDSIRVQAINRETGEETTFVFTIDMEKRPYLEVGEYDLLCSVKGEEDRLVENITVWADSIAVVELLYEPKQKLTRSQKRKRRKQRLIYE